MSKVFLEPALKVAEVTGVNIEDVLNMDPVLYKELCEGQDKKTWTFNPCDLPIYIKALECEACAVSKIVQINGDCRFINNEVFSATFFASDAANHMYDRATLFDVWLR